jgi:GDP-L-fucose synthase
MTLNDQEFLLFSGLGGPLGIAVQNHFAKSRNSLGFRSTDCNLLHKKNTVEFFTSIRSKFPDKSISYIHIAAVSGGSHLSERIPATLFVENIEMAINSLEACRSSKINRVILVLSTSCYSSQLQDPSEQDLHKYPIDTAEFGYSYAKRMFEVLMRAYNKQYKMQISCVLVNGIIGQGMNFDPSKSILPAALIKKFVDNKNNENEIELWGNGEPIREYSSSKDLALALDWCLSNQKPDTLLNIGNSSKISVIELAFLIAEIIGIDKNRIKFNGSKTSGKQIQSTNNGKFVGLSDFKYENIDSAIKEAILSYSGLGNLNHD